MEARIVGLGHLNLDIVAVVPAWERGSKFEATRLFEQVGGPVPVALATMARLGLAGPPPTLIATIGDDRRGDELVRCLAEEGIVVAPLGRITGLATSVSLVMVDTRDGSRTLANYAGDIPPLTLTPAHEALLTKAALLHLDGRDLPASLAAARIVRAAGGLVSLDLGTMRPGREALFSQCDFVIASQKGGAGAFPEAADDPLAQTRRFLEVGIRQVAGVTLGERGVVIGTPTMAPTLLPAAPVDTVVDTNGAGDVFHGAFLWAVLEGWNALEAVEFAQAMAARSVEFYGNRVA